MTVENLKTAVKNLTVYLEECHGENDTVTFTVNVVRSIKENYEELIKFKNKADFVEVIRCEKCEYKDDCARQIVHTTRDYVLEQNISTYNKVDFCSYGEKR